MTFAIISREYMYLKRCLVKSHESGLTIIYVGGDIALEI